MCPLLLKSLWASFFFALLKQFETGDVSLARNIIIVSQFIKNFVRKLYCNIFENFTVI